MRECLSPKDILQAKRVLLWGGGQWWLQMCFALGSLPAVYKTKGASQSLSCIRWGGEKQSKREGADTQCWEGWKGQPCLGPLANRAHSCRAAAMISQVVSLSLLSLQDGMSVGYQTPTPDPTGPSRGCGCVRWCQSWESDKIKCNKGKEPLI